jgi:RHS repeat-associated protein
VSTGGIFAYVDQLTYTELGDPSEYTMGPSAEPAWTVDTYDEQTDALTGQLTQAGTTPATVADQHYSYDNTGQVTAETSTPASGQAQDQCFQYDYLGRLTQAWAQGSPSCSAGPSQAAEAGAAAPYWESYQYNNQNDMTSQVSTPATGTATTTASSYPAAGSAQPHAVSSQTVTGPSGSAAANYTYDKNGDLATVTGSQDETLSWDDQGRLSQLTASSGTTSYVYDADGNLLIQEDPSTTTLYLADEQLTEDNATGTVTGTRYYAIGGQTVAARTPSGGVTYLTGDQQGTQTIAISATTLAATSRYYDPYGNPAGTAPATWPGNQGFQDGTTDTATGLTNLGAHEYNPATSSFISPDPSSSPPTPRTSTPTPTPRTHPRQAKTPPERSPRDPARAAEPTPAAPTPTATPAEEAASTPGSRPPATAGGPAPAAAVAAIHPAGHPPEAATEAALSRNQSSTCRNW